MCETTLYAKTSYVQSKSFTIDGEKYYVYSVKTNDGIHSILEYGDVKIEYNITDDYISATTYECNGKNFFGRNKYEEQSNKQIYYNKLLEHSDNSAVAQMTYATPVKIKITGNYYYSWGTSKYNNTYLKIGCKANYRLKYYALSAAKQNKCDAYVDAIKSSNRYYNTAIATGGTGMVAIIVGAILLMPVTLGISDVIALLVAITGGSVGLVTLLVNSYHDYQDAAEYYEIIKAYGTKI